MSKYKEINVEIFHGYGFKRQELVDYFYSIGKSVNLGIPPMSLDEPMPPEDVSTQESLSDELNRIKALLEKEETKQPLMLGKYRDDDPLLIAIQLRNLEWNSYDEYDRSTAPTADYLVEKLKQDYKMSDALARAIEKVACPIIRK